MTEDNGQVLGDLANTVTGSLQGWIDGNQLLATIAIAALLLLAAWLAQALTRRYLITLISKIFKSGRNRWNEAMFGDAVLHRLSMAVPLIIIRAGLPLLPLLPLGVTDFLQRALSAAIMLVIVSAIVAAVNAFGVIYERHPKSRERPIKSYLQVLVIVLYALAIIAAIAALLNRDPLLILSGIGAASAILLLIFQDTILSLVAGAQLTSNDLIRVGDWIEMPAFQADGDVVEVALNTVKVENWDKTFTVIPAHVFLKNSFKNYRTMYEIGRRIMRNIVIDMDSIRFLTPEETADLERFSLLRPYLESKNSDIAEWNARHEAAARDPVNARRLTNLGTFRAYIEAYLRADPRISNDLLFSIRQLAPSPDGLPMQIYAFTVDTGFVNFEKTQADVFDHLLAILSEFDLRVAQRPTGADMRALGAARQEARASEA